MPRRLRIKAPGRVHHVISRVLNEEFLIGDAEREDYLRRVPRAWALSDWIALAYAIMSNHAHWAKLAALLPLRIFFSSLHTGFARRVNDTQNRRGPLFAGRPSDWIVAPSEIASTIAYIHNNPVRAGVVRSPEESCWTSHRAYIGLEPAPHWLDVELALRMCGFDPTAAGREAFHEFVVREIDRPRDHRLSDARVRAARAQARLALNAPVELGAGTVRANGEQDFQLLAPAGAIIRPRWSGSLSAVIEAVSQETGIATDAIRSTSRSRPVAHARRLAIQLGRAELGFSLTELAAAVGMSPAAACNLVRRYRGDRARFEQSAATLARDLWARG